ncbi:MAG: hypothetical protein ABSE73_31220 [Planctomycetota bacterium]
MAEDVQKTMPMTSSPLKLPPAGPAQLSFGQKLVFMLPGLIIALALAIGVSYWILYTVNEKMKEDLSAAKTELENKNQKLGEEIKKLDSANKDLRKDLEDAKAVQVEIKKGVEKVDGSLKETSKILDDLVKLDLSTYMKKQTAAVDDTKKDIGKHESQIAELNTKIQYIDQKLKKLDELDRDVGGLKINSEELKKECQGLRTDMTSVRKKADITEQDLASLDERARMFQLRVLAARAREAAEAARQVDLKALLLKLDDVEERK